MTTKTSEAKSGAAEAKEFFDVVREASDKSFKKAEEFSAKFVDSMSALRNETLDTWRQSMKASIDLQAEVARKAGITPKVSPEVEEMIHSAADAWARAQNEAANAYIDATKQFIQGYGAAAKAASEVSRSMLAFWLSGLKAKPAAQGS
jgi:hypothetical protein